MIGRKVGMKKVFRILIFSFVLILVCGCDDKKALNKVQITDELSKEGFLITDITDRMEDKSISSVLIATNEDYNIEYYAFKDEKIAKEAYKNNKIAFENYKKNGKETKKETYKKYKQELSDTYNLLIQVDNTLIYASVNIEYKSDLNKVLDNIGY